MSAFLSISYFELHCLPHNWKCFCILLFSLLSKQLLRQCANLNHGTWKSNKQTENKRPWFLTLGSTHGACNHCNTFLINASISGWGVDLLWQLDCLKIHFLLKLRGYLLWSSTFPNHLGRSVFAPPVQDAAPDLGVGRDQILFDESDLPSRAPDQEAGLLLKQGWSMGNGISTCIWHFFPHWYTSLACRASSLGHKGWFSAPTWDLETLGLAPEQDQLLDSGLLGYGDYVEPFPLF